MPSVARLQDSISGMTTGEHSGHKDEFGNPLHPPSVITGYISANCSPNVFVNGKALARVGSVTLEQDTCCGSSYGSVFSGSNTVYVNNYPIARNGDTINAHSGSASITGGSSNVFSN